MIPIAICNSIGRRLMPGKRCRLLPHLPLTILAPVMLAGCSTHAHSPALSLYGSFFPVWLIAALLGAICSVFLRLLLIRVHLHEHLPVAPLTYLCAAALSGIMIWAIWTGELAL